MQLARAVSSTAWRRSTRRRLRPGEIKGNLSQRHRRHDGGTCTSGAEFAKQLGSVIIMIDLVIRLTPQSSRWRNGRGANDMNPASATGQGTPTYYAAAQPRRLVSRESQNGCGLAGVDHIHAGDGGRQARRRSRHHARAITNICREGLQSRQKLEHGVVSSTKNWASLNKMMPVAFGRHSRRPDASAARSFGRRRGCLQFGGGTIGHPMGIQAGATAKPRSHWKR